MIIEDNYISETMPDLCYKNQTTYDQISWTDLKARCNILDSYSPQV